MSLMNPLVQISSYSPKNYGRDMLVGLKEIPHQARKWVSPLVLFWFKTQNPKVSHNEKQKKYKPSHSK